MKKTENIQGGLPSTCLKAKAICVSTGHYKKA